MSLWTNCTCCHFSTLKPLFLCHSYQKLKKNDICCSGSAATSGCNGWNRRAYIEVAAVWSYVLLKSSHSDPGDREGAQNFPPYAPPPWSHRTQAAFPPRSLKSGLVLPTQIFGLFGPPKKRVNFNKINQRHKCVIFCPLSV